MKRLRQSRRMCAQMHTKTGTQHPTHEPGPCQASLVGLVLVPRIQVRWTGRLHLRASACSVQSACLAWSYSRLRRHHGPSIPVLFSMN